MSRLNGFLTYTAILYVQWGEDVYISVSEQEKELEIEYANASDTYKQAYLNITMFQ